MTRFLILILACLSSMAHAVDVGYGPAGGGSGGGGGTVATGGTGLTSLTPYAIVAGGTASTTHMQQISIGTLGQVLTSQGPGALAAWTTVSGTGTVVSVNGASTATGLSLTGGPFTSSGTLTIAFSGAAIPVVNGGTGSTAAMSGATIMVSNGSQIVQGAAGTTTTVLHGNAAGSPSYGAITLTTDVTGILPIANGGTGSSTAAGAFANLAPLATLGDTLYEGVSGPAVLTGNIVNQAYVYQQQGTGTASGIPFWGALTASQVPNLPVSVFTSGILPANRGGNGFDGSAAANGAIGIGTGTGLALNVPTGTSPIIVTPGSGTLNVSLGTVPVANGGTGGNSFTAYALIAGGTTGTSGFQSIGSLGSAGQVLTSQGAGQLPAFQSPAAAVTSINTLTGPVLLAAGANITLSPSGNTITISSSGGGGGGGVSSATNNTVSSSIGVYDTITGSNLQFKPLIAGSGVILTDGGTGGGITIAAGGALHAVSDASYTMLSTQAEVDYSTITANRTVTLPAAAAVNPGVVLTVRDLSGSPTMAINILIARAGSDTIEGGTTGWTIRTAKGFRSFTSDGVSNWHLVGMSRDIQIFTSNGTWYAEPGAQWGIAEMLAAGAGGGGGAQQPNGTASCGGGGGSGGGYSIGTFRVADAGASQPVVVGVGGTGGTGASSTGSAGANSTAGGNSSFGVGTAAVAISANGGSLSTGGGAGVAGLDGASGYGSNAGWLGGSASATGGAGNAAQSGYNLAAGGGGAGGGLVTAGTPFAFGGHGGSGGLRTSNFGSPGSQGNSRVNTDGAAGQSPSSISPSGYCIGAPGAAGGSSSVAGIGGAGGTGATPGGGGGGGGASANGHSGGAGGNGGSGVVVVSQVL